MLLMSKGGPDSQAGRRGFELRLPLLTSITKRRLGLVASQSRAARNLFWSRARVLELISFLRLTLHPDGLAVRIAIHVESCRLEASCHHLSLLT